MRGSSIRKSLILIIMMALGLGLTGRPAWPSISRQDAAGIDALNDIDHRNEDMLDDIIEASNESMEGDSNVSLDEGQLDEGSGKSEKTDYIKASSRKVVDVSGTGGVALLEQAKENTTNTVSNITSAQANATSSKKSAERKMGQG